ncbi:MAG: hypothetical protein IJT38_01670 [Clostridia bacterium]|nr:hypothetical protein [Clostridia bacterium]
MIIKKLIKVGIVFAVVCGIAAIVLINGITIDISGVICFNTKFYSTPGESLASGDIDVSGEIRDIATVHIDDYNAIYLALCGEGDILAAQMKKGGSGYHFMGNYIVYHTADSEMDNTYSEDKTDVLGQALSSSVKYAESNIYCGLFTRVPEPNDANVNSVDLPFDGFKFVYFIK